MAKPVKEWRSYKEKTFEELDAEVEEAIQEERARNLRRILIFVLIMFFIFPDAFLYWFRFATPHFAKYKTDNVINVKLAPVQKAESGNIVYTTLENKDKFDLKVLAKYSISGKVVAKNYYFWGNYLPGGRRPFQETALIDIGLVWGDLADKDILSYYRFVSAKDVVARALYPRLKFGVKVAPFSWKEANSMFSHTHIIPANASIMHALLFTRKNQPIKMEGYLVDVYYNGKSVAQTSLSRTDTNQTARGGGACEIMYVNRVQIGKKVYE